MLINIFTMSQKFDKSQTITRFTIASAKVYQKNGNINCLLLSFKDAKSQRRRDAK